MADPKKGIQKHENEGSFNDYIFLVESYGGNVSKNIAKTKYVSNKSFIRDQDIATVNKEVSIKNNNIDVSGYFDNYTLKKRGHTKFVNEKDLIFKFAKKDGYLKLGDSVKVKCICDSFKWSKEGSIYKFSATFSKVDESTFIGKKPSFLDFSNDLIGAIVKESSENLTEKLKGKNISVTSLLSKLDGLIDSIVGIIEDRSESLRIINDMAKRIRSSVAKISNIISAVIKARELVKDFVNIPFKFVAQINDLLFLMENISFNEEDIFLSSKNTREFLMNSMEAVEQIGDDSGDVEYDLAKHMATVALCSEIKALIETINNREAVLSDNELLSDDNSDDISLLPILRNEVLFTNKDIINARDNILDAIDILTKDLNDNEYELADLLTEIKILLFENIPTESNIFPNIKYVENNGKITNPFELCYEYYGDLKQEQIFSIRNNLFEDLIVDEERVEVVKRDFI